MNCPRCQRFELTELDREGLVIDVCAVCRGVWLDRGELEKLIGRATREFDEMHPRCDDTPPHGIRYRAGDEDHQHSPKRKRRWIDALSDIFD